jgi:hypothetical protein
MKALIWKELREQRVLAVLGFIVFTGLVWATLKIAGSAAEQPLWDNGNPIDRIQPLVADGFRINLCLLCAAFAGILGWMQIYQERHRDLWAFMIHRPVPQTALFSAKAVAGMILYFTVAGLPLLGLVLWVQVPGQIAAPFELSMALPSLAIFLAGIVAYFTGMLIALRRARWFGSQALPAGIAALAFIASIAAPSFGAALWGILIAGVIVIIATHGTFQAHGEYASQSAVAKVSLATSITAGTFIICLFGAGIIAIKIREHEPQDYAYYSVGVDGTVYKTTYRSGERTKTFTLDGKHMVDPKTKENLRPNELPNLLAATSGLMVSNTRTRQPNNRLYAEAQNYFTHWKSESGVIWYYWKKSGRVVGYDARSRRLIGSFGPDGFATDAIGKDRFLPPLNLGNGFVPTAMRTERNAFLLDLKNQKVQSLLPEGADNKVVDAIIFQASNESPKYVAVSTETAISLFTGDGKPLWNLPYDFDRPDYNQVHVAVLNGPEFFSVSPKPSTSALLKTEGKIPTLFMQVSSEKGVIKKETLPSIYRGDPNELPLSDKLLIAVGSPLLLLGLSLLFPLTAPVLPFAFAYGGICMIIGLILNQRYATSKTSRIGWAVFHLLMGLPGLWAYVCARDWPTREKCSACGKPRNVEHAHCEHCHAPFPAPEKNGVEIFEPVTAE